MTNQKTEKTQCNLMVVTVRIRVGCDSIPKYNQVLHPSQNKSSCLKTVSLAIQINRIVIGAHIHYYNLSGVEHRLGNYLNINKFSLISND